MPIITVPISIVDDNFTNANREFSLTLTDTALSTAFVNVTVPEAAITIIDDDNDGPGKSLVNRDCMHFSVTNCELGMS